MSLNAQQVESLLKMIQDTQDIELSCPECAAELDCYAQKILDGECIEGVLDLVKQHLNACPGCNDEFHMILEAIRAVGESEDPPC